MIRLVATLCSVVCLVGVGVTQTVHTVFPSDHTGTAPNLTISGATYENYTPYSYGVMRQMIFYDAWDVRIPNGRAISRIGFAADGSSSWTGYPLMLKVQMGQSTLPLSSVSTTFSQNFSSPPTVVFGSASGGAKIFTLPNLGGTTGTDIVWLPLDAPFTYDASKSLVIDFQVSANQNGNSSFVYRLDEARHRSPQRSFNLACPTSGGRTPALASSPNSSYIDGTWYLSLTGGPATTPMALLVGLAPYEPGISLTPVGAPGCLLSVDSQWSGAYTTSSSGSKSFSFPIPLNRSLFGARLYSQAVMQDVFANSLGWITSNGDELQLGIRPQAKLIRGAQGNAQATTGSVAANYGLITIFEHN